MEKIRENVHVLCFHVKFNMKAQKHARFHVNFPFSAYMYSYPHYIIMVNGSFPPSPPLPSPPLPSPPLPGVVPVVIRPPLLSNLPASLPTIKLTLEISNSRAILTTHSVIRVLKTKVSHAALHRGASLITRPHPLYCTNHTHSGC